MPRAAVSVASSTYHSFPQPVKKRATPPAATLKMGAGESRNSGGAISTDEKNQHLLRVDNIGPSFYYAHGQGQVISNPMALGAAFQGSVGENSTHETRMTSAYYSHHNAFPEKHSQQQHHSAAAPQDHCDSQDNGAAVDSYTNAPFGYYPDREEEEEGAAAGAGEKCVQDTMRTIKHTITIAHARAGAGTSFRSDDDYLDTNALPFGEGFRSAVGLARDAEAHLAEHEEEDIAISDSTCVSVLAGAAEEEEVEEELFDPSLATAEGVYKAPARLPPHLSYLDDDDEDNDNSSDPAVQHPCSGRDIHDACDENTIAASSSFTRYSAHHNEENGEENTTHYCGAPGASEEEAPSRDEERPNDVAPHSNSDAFLASSSSYSKPPLPFPAAFPLSSSSATSHNNNNNNNSASKSSDKHFSSCTSSLGRVSPSSPFSGPAPKSSDHRQDRQDQPQHHHHQSFLYRDNEATVPIIVTALAAAAPPLPLTSTTAQGAVLVHANATTLQQQHIGLDDEEEELLYDDTAETPLVKGEGPHYCEDTPLGLLFSLSSEEGEVLLHRTHFAERRRILARIALRNVPDDRMRLSKIASRVAGHMLISYDAFTLIGFQPFIVHDAREWADYVNTREGLSQTERLLMKTSDHTCPSYWRVALASSSSSSSSRVVVYSRAYVFTSRSGTRNFIQVMFDGFAQATKFFTEPLTFFAALCYLDRIHAYYYATLVNGLAPADAPAPMRLYEGHYVRIFITLIIISCKMHADLKAHIKYFVEHVRGMGLSGLTCEEIALCEREVLNVLGFNAHVSKTHVQSLLASFASTEDKYVAESLLFY